MTEAWREYRPWQSIHDKYRWARDIEDPETFEPIWHGPVQARDLTREQIESLTPWDALEHRMSDASRRHLHDLSPSRQFTKITRAATWITMMDDPAFLYLPEQYVDCGPTKRVLRGASTYQARMGSDGRYHPIDPETGRCAFAGTQRSKRRGTHTYCGTYISRSRGCGRRREKLEGTRIKAENIATDRFESFSITSEITYDSDDVLLTDVPIHLRCPEPTRTFWPLAEIKSTTGRMRRRIIDEFGPWCMTCGGDYGIYLDHDHLTNVVRGLLCHECNLWVDGCWDAAGCWRSDYLESPPLERLNLRYPLAAATRRSEPYRRTVHVIETYDEFAHLRPYLA